MLRKFLIYFFPILQLKAFSLPSKLLSNFKALFKKSEQNRNFEVGALGPTKGIS
jgi:hypothetical protein